LSLRPEPMLVQTFRTNSSAVGEKSLCTRTNTVAWPIAELPVDACMRRRRRHDRFGCVPYASMPRTRKVTTTNGSKSARRRTYSNTLLSQCRRLSRYVPCHVTARSDVVYDYIHGSRIHRRPRLCGVRSGGDRSSAVDRARAYRWGAGRLKDHSPPSGERAARQRRGARGPRARCSVQRRRHLWCSADGDRCVASGVQSTR